MEEWMKQTIKELRGWNHDKLADTLEFEWHEHDFISETLERLDRKHIIVGYQCIVCHKEFTEIEALPPEG